MQSLGGASMAGMMGSRVTWAVVGLELLAKGTSHDHGGDAGGGSGNTRFVCRPGRASGMRVSYGTASIRLTNETVPPQPGRRPT